VKLCKAFEEKKALVLRLRGGRSDHLDGTLGKEVERALRMATELVGEDTHINNTETTGSLNPEVRVDDTPVVGGLGEHRGGCRVPDGRGDGADVLIDGGIIDGSDEFVAGAAGNVVGPGRGTGELEHGTHTLAKALDIDLGGQEVGVDKGSIEGVLGFNLDPATRRRRDEDKDDSHKRATGGGDDTRAEVQVSGDHLPVRRARASSGVTELMED